MPKEKSNISAPETLKDPFDLIAGMIESHRDKGGLILAVWDFIQEHPEKTVADVIDHFTIEELKRQERIKYGRRKRR